MNYVLKGHSGSGAENDGTGEEIGKARVRVDQVEHCRLDACLLWFSSVIPLNDREGIKRG